MEHILDPILQKVQELQELQRIQGKKEWLEVELSGPELEELVACLTKWRNEFLGAPQCECGADKSR